MKKIFLFLSLSLSTFAGDILMGTTTSLDDTGFLNVISDSLKKEKGINLKWIAKGTGEALELGKRGDVDILFTHDPTREQKFIDDGYALKRYPLMNNFFVIVTNEDKDISNFPKDLNGLLKKIADDNLVFISRGDNSGTHSKELSIWKNAGIKNSFINYKEAGLGMAKTLNLTSELEGFTLSDSGTFLKTKNNFKTKDIPLIEKNELKNVYSILELTNTENSKEKDIKIFIEFMHSKAAQDIIQNFGLEEFNKPLFFLEAN